MPDFTRERLLGGRVAGIDEAGRGPLAGPVTAAAVVLDPARLPDDLLRRIDDSKKLSHGAREDIYQSLMALRGDGLWFATASASVAEIDRVNILQATFLAMGRAFDGVTQSLGALPAAALIDGNRAPKGLPCRVETVIGGDGICLSIACASILAKVTRDREMTALARDFPGYGWERNMGYGTAAHLAGLARLGITPHHRRSFAPVARCLGPRGAGEGNPQG